MVTQIIYLSTSHKHVTLTIVCLTNTPFFNEVGKPSFLNWGSELCENPTGISSSNVNGVNLRVWPSYYIVIIL